MSERKARVLVVDDDKGIREVICATLEAEGYEVHAIADGIEALEPKEQFDAVLLDLQMPVFDGEKLFDYWHMTQPHLARRVVIMTAYAHRPWRGVRQPFALLHKPFEHRDIVRVVADCVAHSRSLGAADERGSLS